jgi:hypothetical protein
MIRQYMLCKPYKACMAKTPDNEQVLSPIGGRHKFFLEFEYSGISKSEPSTYLRHCHHVHYASMINPDQSTAADCEDSCNDSAATFH